MSGPKSYRPADILNSSAARQITETIGRHAMIEGGDRVLVAVSGGSDSTALLHLLHAMTTGLGITLAVAHLNHGLRGKAADADARFVEDMATGLKITCHLDRIRLDPSQGSVEERGRRARYAFFQKLAETHGYTKIALGHQMDDNAEVVLMHLLRGSGTRGLSAIPPVRGRRIIRPLIDLRRTEIVRFLVTHGIAFVEDQSNADLKFVRNRIRHRLIPFLQQHFSCDVVPALHRTADLCREDERWMRDLVAPVLEDSATFFDSNAMTLEIRMLSSFPLAGQRRLIRDGLLKWQGRIKGLGANHIDDIIKLLACRSKGKRICLPNRIGVERTDSHLRFTIRQDRGFPPPPAARTYQYHVQFPGSESLILDIPESGVRFRFTVSQYREGAHTGDTDANTACFDASQLSFPLSIRSCRPGDRMRPLGLNGHQKVKKIFSDRKIPASRRHRIPLLISGSDILWVAGIRRSALAIPAAGSAQVLEVRITACP